MSILAPLLSRQATLVGWAALAVLLGLTGCAEQGTPGVATGGGNLYAQGLDDIADVYVEPVSTRHVALTAAARLARLDGRLGVSDSFGAGFAGALSLSYDNRDIAFYAIPGDADRRQWGELLTTIVATAKQASPRLAAMPQIEIDKAIFDGMTGALDRFSRYSDPEVARDQREARHGYGGIGITFDEAHDLFRITAVTPQGPADNAGLHPDDRVVAIDGVATAGQSHEEVAHRLRGPIGSAIALNVLSPGAAAPRELRLHRAFVIGPSVTVSRDGDIAIFKITNFNQSTTQRVSEGIAELQRQTGNRLAGIVLDLRSNPGGLLDQAVSLASLFISKGPIVSTTGRHPASHQDFAASGNSVAPLLPIAVLINGTSASSAEIVASALQDTRRAVVLGSSSYGKGSVQTVMRLPNDGDLIVTWARLVTPDGYLLQQHGVVPTMCTTGLKDTTNAIAMATQWAQAAGPAARPRAGLDEAGWAALRAACPASQTSPPVDLKLAQRLLADPKLYAEALQANSPATRLADRVPAGPPAEPGLTEANRALSSGER